VNPREMIEAHADREDFTYEVIQSTLAPPTESVVFKNLNTGKVYRLTLEETTDPRPKPRVHRRRR
jgi:hypothetical protein